MEDCIFCKIVRGEIPSNKVYEDEQVLAFYDIEPQAPVHILLVPKQHFTSVMDVDSETFGYMQTIVKRLAEELGIAEKGFRIVINTGEHGQQSVKHLHFHIMGGRSMQWPPG